MQLSSQLLAIASLALLVGCAGPLVAPPSMSGADPASLTNVGAASATALATLRAPLASSTVASPGLSTAVPVLLHTNCVLQLSLR